VICWDRQADSIIGYFSPRQIRWFRQHVGAFRESVLSQRKWRALERHLIEVLDIEGANQQHRQYVSAGGSLPAGVPAWASGGLQMGGHDIEWHMLVDAELVLGSLPATGGVVVLPDQRYVWAWIWALYECAMHLSFRLGLTWEPPHTGTYSTADRAHRSFSKVMAWLMMVVDTLIDVADLRYPVIGA
jgi:hypothetical protein